MADITSIPPASDQRWKDIATGKINKPWALLAMKIMMTRISGSVKNDSSPANVDKCAAEIHSFFEKNLKIAQQDLAQILG